jgi:hypothetical protein
VLELLTQHQFWAAVVVYWIFSAAVSSMPDPASDGSSGYLWLFRFLHTIAGNLTTTFGSKIPAPKAPVTGFAIVKPAENVIIARENWNPGKPDLENRPAFRKG